MTDEYREPPTFSLGELAPKPLRFRDDGEGGDGQFYDVRTPLMFNDLEQARLASLQQTLPQQLAEIGTMADQEQIAEALSLLGGILNDFVRLLIPALPEERLKSIGTASKIAFIKWWTAETKKSGEATAGNRKQRRAERAKTPRAQRSPASSPSTTSTRNES
jgi:hypothetical protein